MARINPISTAAVAGLLALATSACSPRVVALIPEPRAAVDSISEPQLRQQCQAAVHASRHSPWDLIGHASASVPDSGTYRGFLILRGLRRRGSFTAFDKKKLADARKAPPLVPIELHLTVVQLFGEKSDSLSLLGFLQGNFCSYCLNDPRSYGSVQFDGWYAGRLRDAYLRFADGFYFGMWMNMTHNDTSGMFGAWEIADGDDILPAEGVFCAVRTDGERS